MEFEDDVGVAKRLKSVILGKHMGENEKLYRKLAGMLVWNLNIDFDNNWFLW